MAPPEQNKKTKSLFNFAALWFIIGRIYLQGNGFDGFTFTLIWTILICANYNSASKIIDNKVFAFCGKYITELFVLHVVLYYVLVQNQRILVAGKKTFGLIIITSVLIAPIMSKYFTKPVSNMLLNFIK